MPIRLLSGRNTGIQQGSHPDRQTNGTTCHQTRIPVMVYPWEPGTPLYLAYQNETIAGGATILVNGSLELNGVCYSGTFSGSADVSIPSGTNKRLLTIDTTSIPSITVPTLGYIRTRVRFDYAAGQRFSYNVRLRAGTANTYGNFTNDVNAGSTTQPTTPATTDLTLGGAFPATQSFDSVCYSAVGLFGTPRTGTSVHPILAIFDSWGDVPFDFRGWQRNWLDAYSGTYWFPYIHDAKNGSGLGVYALATPAETDYAEYLETIVGARGVNDLGSSTVAAITEATMVARLIAFADRWHAKGLRVVGTTIPPNTTGPWTSPEAQVAKNSNFVAGGARANINARLRDSNDSLRAKFDAMFDLAAVVEDTAIPAAYRNRERISGVGTAITTDGLHVDQAGHGYLQAAFQEALLLPANTTPPTITSSTTNTGGTTLDIVFDKQMRQLGAVGLSVVYATRSQAITESRWVDAYTLRCTLPTAVAAGTTPTLAYNDATGNIGDTALPINMLVGFGSGAINNQSTFSGGSSGGGTRRRPTRGRG